MDAVANDGHCSLREAVTSVNLHAAPFTGAGECASGTGEDVVVLPAGRFVLSIPGRGDDNNDSGDLDIRAIGVTFRGAGAALTTIYASHLDRVVDVLSGAVVTIEGVTITGGTTQDGTSGTDMSGGFDVTAGDGGPGEPGGGIRNLGALTIEDSDAVPATGAGCPATDQRGVPRPQGAACDIGAFERNAPAPVTPPPGGATPPPGVSATPRATLARLTHMTLSPRVFRAAPTGPSALAARARFGTRVSYTLNENARVRFQVGRPMPGRHARGGQCVAPSRRNRKARKCTRLVLVRGAFTKTGTSGVNEIRFTGRIGAHRLDPGVYRLRATPSAGGRPGRTTAAAFTIIR